MSMDRELLELAAKAAELKILGGFGCGDRPGCDVLDQSRASGTRWWSPLTDDGDALRLAVYVKIDVYFEEGAPEVGASTGHHGRWVMGALEFIQEDAFAATRRAIVRAAAEIGRRIP